MKDIHNHILYGIDDGSDDINESINIIENAIKNGYTDLILTPHYRRAQAYTCNNQDKKKYFNILKTEVKRRNININLYLGNEITIDKDLFNYINNDEVTTLCNSKYLLLELPFFSAFPRLQTCIKKLVSLGYVPIIAHPERCTVYSTDDFEKMIKDGALLQGDNESLFGKYGTKAKNKLETMLKRHMIHFMGSDVHHDTSTCYNHTKMLISKLIKLTGDKRIAYEIVNVNIEKVIRNESITPYQVKKVRYKLKLFK